MGHTEMSA